MRNAMLFLLVTLGVLAAGCIGEGYAAPKQQELQFGAKGEKRSNCGEILGTAFRSAEERQWFEQNCSKWPPTNFDALAQAKPNQPPECDAMRGRPYASERDRAWYLATCFASNPPAAQSGPPPSGLPQAGPDRTDCNAIRGSLYRSPAERAWFLQNCPSQQVPGQPQGPAPGQQQPNLTQGTQGTLGNCTPGNSRSADGRGRRTQPCILRGDDDD